MPAFHCPHDNPSFGLVSRATGCEHSFTMPDRARDGTGHRLKNHGDLSVAEEHASKFLPSKTFTQILRFFLTCLYLSALINCLCPCLLTQLPNGVTYHPNTHQDRLGKLQEHLRMLSALFRKLRLVYDKCNENCAAIDTIPPEVSAYLSLFLFKSWLTIQDQKALSFFLKG